MKTRLGIALAFIVPLLLAACGGSQPAADTPVSTSISKRSGDVATDYHDLVQRIYVAYFGRPADPAGLDYWADAFRTHKLPLTLNEINASYASSASVRQFVDAFSNSEESMSLYPSNNSDFIHAVYRNLYNREPDAGGKAFWVDALDKGIMSRASAALWIMGSAQASDITIIDNKVTVARAFTAALDTTTESLSYNGPVAVAFVRAMLASVDELTDAANYPVQLKIDEMNGNCGFVGCPPVRFLTYIYNFYGGTGFAGLISSTGDLSFASLPAERGRAVADYVVGAASASFYMHSAVLWKNDRLYRQNLVSTRGMPLASIVSTLSLGDLCGMHNTRMSDVYDTRTSEAYDLVTPMHSYVVYRGKGADGLCASPDDAFFAVRMDMPETAAPLTVREPVHTLHDANGVLTGFLVRNGQSIERVDANFANPVSLFTLAGDDLSTLGHVGEQANTWLFTSGANVYTFTAGTPDLVLSLAAGETVGTALSIDTQDVFISINSGQSGVRVVRYGLAGKTASTVGSISLAGTGATMHLTQTRVLLVNDGAVYALARSGGAAQEILAGSGAAIATVVGERIWLHHHSPEKVVSVMSDGSGALTFALAGQAGCTMNGSLLIINTVNLCESILVVDGNHLKSYNGTTGVLELDYGSLPAKHAGQSGTYTLTPYASNGQGAVLTISELEGWHPGPGSNYYFKLGQAGIKPI